MSNPLENNFIANAIDVNYFNETKTSTDERKQVQAFIAAKRIENNAACAL